MAVRNFALGTLSPILYFENSSGMIAMPPSTEFALRAKDKMRARGFELREACTLAQIDDLQRRINQHELRLASQRGEVEEQLQARIKNSIRDRLYARMVSSSTSSYEKEFLRLYLQMREEKRERHRNRFSADQGHFIAREMNEKAAMQSVIDRVEQGNPDSKDTACERCHNYRKMIGRLCGRCAEELARAQS